MNLLRIHRYAVAGAGVGPADRPSELHPKLARRFRLTCIGLFLSSSRFGLFPVLCSAERPFFVPSPAIRFAERAEGVKGPKR